MRIVHTGHGRIPIPPVASGATEIIISDYGYWIERYGHEFKIVNNLSPAESMMESEAFRPDVAHLHDESKLAAFETLDAPIKIVTTHDPTFFEKPNAFKGRFMKGDFLIGCLSQQQRDRFRSWGIADSRIIDAPNGARADLIRYIKMPQQPNRMVCLGMIGQRKRQSLLLPMPFVDLVGPLAQYDPVPTWHNPTAGIGLVWSKNEVFEKLPHYAALVLISKSEAAPLVVMEALMAGLDVVVSEAASANLDRSQPFIHVLDENTINNPTLLEIALRKVLGRTKDRSAVRAYAEQHHNWETLVQRYLTNLFFRLGTTQVSYPKTQPSPKYTQTCSG